MQFDWDDANVSHIARHDITPEEAEQVIQNDPIDGGTAIRNGETRTVSLGETDASRVLFVVTTERGEKIRIVTARSARRNEREFYAKHKAVTNDQDPTDP